MVKIQQTKGYNSLRTFCRAAEKRVADDWDMVIAITGEEGVGKSTLGVVLSQEMDDRFDWIRSVAYLPSHKEIEDKFFALKSKQVFLVDEAIKVLYKLKWADKLQIRINEMYATERWQNKITILCIPRFTDLNEMFRNHRVKIWIHVMERGHAVAFIKDETNIFFSDPWHLKENATKILKYTKNKKSVMLASEEKITMFKRSINFWFDFYFPDLPEDQAEIYRRIKADMRKVGEIEDPKLVKLIEQRNIFILWVYTFCLLKTNDKKYKKVSEAKMARIFGMTQQGIGQIIKTQRQKLQERHEYLEDFENITEEVLT